MAKTVLVKSKFDSSGIDKGADQATKSVDGVGEATEGVSNKLDQMSGGAITAFRSFVKGGKSAVVAMTTLKGAIAATGIGALVLVVASLVSYFTKTQRGADMVSKATAALGAVMNVLTDRLSKVGELLVSAFEDPQQTIKDLWDVLKDNFINRLKAVPALVTAIGKVIKEGLSLNFDAAGEAAKDAGAAFIQLNTGLDEEQQKKFAEGVKGVVDEVENETDATTRLEAAYQKLEKRKIDFITSEQKLKTEIEAARLASEDFNLSLNERMRANQRAIDLERQLANERMAIAQEDARIIRERNALGETLNEDLEKQAQAEAEVLRIQAERDTRLTELIGKQRTLRAENEANQIEPMQRLADKTDELENRKQAKFRETTDVIKKLNQEAIDSNEKRINNSIKLEERKEAARASVVQAGSAVIQDILGQQSENAKYVAAAEATFNTYAAIAGNLKAFSGVPIPGYAIAQAIATGAFGLLQVKKILSTPTASRSSGNISRGGGSAARPSSQETAQRTPNIDALNRGVGGGQGGIEPARAYVVNQEIKDKSKLAQRIEDSARLG